MRRNLLSLLAAAVLLVHAPAHAQRGEEADEATHDHGDQESSGMRPPPQSSASESKTLPAGSIETLVLDGKGHPLANIEVALAASESSVAKGDSRERLLGVTNAEGMVRWDGLKTGMGFSYRVSVSKDGATFPIAPFQLNPERGMTTKLYVFPVVRNVKDAIILSKGVIYIEIKDDRVQIEQMLTIANFGENAWVPDDYTLDMPAKMQAFTNDPGMSEVGVDRVEGKDQLRLHGTFAPGQQQIVFRWQLPYSGERELAINVEAPPNMAQARVLAAAAQKMRIDSEGMPASKTDDMQGQRLLTIDWDQLNAKSPIKEFRVRLHDIPESGLPAWLMRSGVGLAAMISLSAIVIVRSGKRRNDARARKDSRALLLDELSELEQAHGRGDIGPKTYERARRELVDQIALTLAA